MTDKKKHKHEDEVSETPPEDVFTPESGGQAQAEIEALTKRLEEAEAKASEYKDGWQRTQADFVNYRNRMTRDNELTYAMMKGDIVKKVLPVLDDLERALANRSADDAWASGIELIVRKFQVVMESEGLKRIEAEGKPFDPNFHEAVSQQETAEIPEGQVVQQLRKGYKLKERLLRPVTVIVAKRPPAAA